MVLSPMGLRPEQNCAGKDYQQQQITDSSSSQRGHYKITNPQLSTENFKEKEKLVTGLIWVPNITTGWPTDCRS
jgi:hypothetical protein